jgi:hypothetical protein
MERERKVDVSGLSEEQLQSLMEQIGLKLVDMTSATVEKANKMLAVYGLKAKMQIALEPND